MRSSNLKQCFINSSPSSSSSSSSSSPFSKRKASLIPLYFFPISLAFVTSFLTLWYLSFFFVDEAFKSPSSPPWLVILSHHQNQKEVRTDNRRIFSGEEVRHGNNVTLFEENELHAKRLSNGVDEGHLLSKESVVPPHHAPLELGSSLSGSSASKHMTNQDIYHDKEIFLQNYEEMKRTLKIYIYPHNKSHPFANALLPTHSNQEPGGNYASEAYFKNVLYKSHFITKDPSEADFFFLPFSIASLRHDRRIGVAGLSDFIRDYMRNISRDYPYWNRTGGSDHFYAACHSIGKVAMEKVEYVKSNAIQVVCSSSYFLPNYFAHKDVCLPQIWPRHDEPQDLANTSKRKKLAFFAGTVMSSVRKYLVQTWKNDSSIFAHNGRLNTPYSDQLLESKYCLHAKGFEVNTARIGDALYYGCVPVILADYYDLPFMDILNWRAFSVVVKASDISNLKKILQGISSEEYSVMQANVLKVRKHFQWHKSPVDFDAFYTVMYELWLRRSSVRILS